MSEQGPNKIIKSAYGALKRLTRELDPQYTVQPEVAVRVVRSALTQHNEHLRIHNIDQKSIDAYKITCWLGGALLTEEKGNEANCQLIIDGMLAVLGYFMVYESDYKLRTSPEETRLLKSFVLQEHKGNYNHGIWMNGLYMAFRCPYHAWTYGTEKWTPPM